MEISAAHRLESPHLSEEENRKAYGPCFGDHGHNYEIEVTVRGPVSARTGMVMNLADLSALMHERIFTTADHKHLNHDVPFLAGVIPTAENFAVAIWGQIEPDVRAFEGCELRRVTVYESRRNVATYCGETRTESDESKT